MLMIVYAVQYSTEVTDCDECGEKFKCGEDFEDHLVWCRWCDESKGCSGQPGWQPDCGHFYVQVVTQFFFFMCYTL